MKKIGFLSGVLALSLMMAMVFTGCDAPFVNPSSETETDSSDSNGNASDAENTDTDETQETDSDVYVDTAQDFVAAITSGARIHLAPGTYNVTDCLTMSTVDDDELLGMSGEYVGSINEYDGYQLAVANVNDLTIVCDDYMNPAEIVCEPRYADVMYFVNCTNVNISNVVMGHTPDQGSCEGSVLGFSQCSNINLASLDLYGCGTYGIESYDSQNLAAKKVKIHDCSYGLMEIYRSKNVSFDDCTMIYDEGYSQLELSTSQVTFTDCTFIDLESYTSFLECDEDSLVTFQNCSLSATEVETLDYFSADNVLVIQ